MTIRKVVLYRGITSCIILAIDETFLDYRKKIPTLSFMKYEQIEEQSVIFTSAS